MNKTRDEEFIYAKIKIKKVITVTKEKYCIINKEKMWVVEIDNGFRKVCFTTINTNDLFKKIRIELGL